MQAHERKALSQARLEHAVECLSAARSLLESENYQHQMEQENEAMQMRSEFARLQTEKAYYDILEQQNQQLMLYAHDAKNHLAAIGSLSDDPRIGGYLSKLSAQLSDYTRNCHSGNRLRKEVQWNKEESCLLQQDTFDRQL